MKRVTNKNRFLFNDIDDYKKGVVQPRDEADYLRITLSGTHLYGNRRASSVRGITLDEFYRLMQLMPFDYWYIKEEFYDKDVFSATSATILVFDVNHPDLPDNYMEDPQLKKFLATCERIGFSVLGPDKHRYVSGGFVNQPVRGSAWDACGRKVKVGDWIQTELESSLPDGLSEKKTAKAEIYAMDRNGISCGCTDTQTGKKESFLIRYDKHFLKLDEWQVPPSA